MEFFVAQLLSGISLGGQYALIAIGYTMVYGILRLINFAHGDVFMCAGLMMVFMCASLPVYVSIPLMLVLTVLLGFVIERAAYKPLRSAPRMSVMISAIGVSYLLQNVALYATGGQPQTYPSLPFVSDTVTILGATTHVVTVSRPCSCSCSCCCCSGSSTTRRSAWPCARSQRILRPASSWASRSTRSSP